MKVTWKECPLLRMSRQVEGSYFRLSGFSSASKDAAPGTMSMGDWRGPLAIGKLSHHLSGPRNDIIMEKLGLIQCESRSMSFFAHLGMVVCLKRA